MSHYKINPFLGHLDRTDGIKGLVNGTFKESFDFTVDATGGVITGTLEQTGGGDLTAQFSTGDVVIDCTPNTNCTVTLTAGTTTALQDNYVYLDQADNTLKAATDDWIATEHIKVAFVSVLDAAHTEEDEGAIVNQNWNDHLSGTNNMGHLTHIGENIRLTADGAHYHSGLGATVNITTNVGTPDNVSVAIAEGVLYQMHKHTFTAATTSDTSTHVVNDNSTPYVEVDDLNEILTDSTGSSMSGNYFNLFLWAVANKTGEPQDFMINLPAGSYNVESDAINDVNQFNDTSMPSSFTEESSTGFPLYIFTFKHSVASGGTWTLSNTRDMRKSTTTGGGTSGLTDHGALGGLLDDDHTQYVKNDAEGTDITNGTFNLTTTGTAFLGLVDLGTNTIYDGNMTGNWAMNNGNITGVNKISFGSGDRIEFNGDWGIYQNNGAAEWLIHDESESEMRFNADIIPRVDNQWDIGKSGQELANLWVDGTAYVDTLSGARLTSGCSVGTSIHPTSNKVYDLGLSTLAYDDMNADNFFNRGPRDFSQDDTIASLKNIQFKAKTANMSNSKKHAYEHAGVYASETDLDTFPLELTSYYSDKEKREKNTDPVWVKENIDFTEDLIEGKAKHLKKTKEEMHDEMVQEYIDKYKEQSYDPETTPKGEYGFDIGNSVMYNMKNTQELLLRIEALEDEVQALKQA